MQNNSCETLWWTFASVCLVSFIWQSIVFISVWAFLILFFTFSCEILDLKFNWCQSQLFSLWIMFNSFHVRDFPFKVWVGGSSIFSEETKHPPRLHSHPCFLYFAVCAGSQPAIVDSFKPRRYHPQSVVQKRCGRFWTFHQSRLWHLCFTWHVHLWCCL